MSLLGKSAEPSPTAILRYAKAATSLAISNQHQIKMFNTRMRCINKNFITLIFAILTLTFANAADLAVGKPIPAIQVKFLDNNQTVQIGGKTGKVTIINFWATWCAPCRSEMPALQSYYEKHKAEGLEIIAISMDDPKDIEQVRKVSQSFTFPVAMKNDCDYKGLGRVWRMPSTFVVDRNGILQKNGHVGQPTVDLEILETVVTPLLHKP